MANTKSWLTAFRLRTLPLAFSGWLVGISIASVQGEIDGWVAGLTLLTAFLLQILSNLANDYGDAVSGVDSDDRQGPSRMVQSGVITKRAMGRAIIIFSVLSLISGCLLLFLAFQEEFLSAIVFFVIGLLGIVAAIKYTVGKNPYGYVGFGDLFVFVFFGIVLVFGTYYLQIQRVAWTVFLPAISMGLFSVGVLNVNNIRDIESDKASGKNSIPVRIGRAAAVRYHAFLLQGGVFTSLLFVYFNFQSWWQFLFMLSNIIFVLNIRAVAQKPLRELDPYLKQMALSALLFAVLLALGILVS